MEPSKFFYRLSCIYALQHPMIYIFHLYPPSYRKNWYHDLKIKIKYTLLFWILICLLNHRYWESMVLVDGTEASQNKNLLQFRKILGNIKGSMKFFPKYFSIRKRGIIFHSSKFVSNSVWRLQTVFYTECLHLSKHLSQSCWLEFSIWVLVSYDSK